MASDTVLVHIKRQNGPGEKPYMESFNVARIPEMNVITLLQEIRRNPITVDGKKVEPVVWDSNCLEEVCGACTMLINGQVRQACSALVDKLTTPITLTPMSKFPVVRDLMVNRQQMFENLKKVKAWVPIDGTYDLGQGPRIPEAERLAAYWYSRCMTCGCCLEACPQFEAIEGDEVKDSTKFMGAQIMGQVRLFNTHPTSKTLENDRLDILMGPGGIASCGNAQNCVEVCPKEIPLLDAIADLGWSTAKRSLKRIFGE